jgi:hypothetical protein
VITMNKLQKTFVAGRIWDPDPRRKDHTRSQSVCERRLPDCFSAAEFLFILHSYQS